MNPLKPAPYFNFSWKDALVVLVFSEATVAFLCLLIHLSCVVDTWELFVGSQAAVGFTMTAFVVAFLVDWMMGRYHRRKSEAMVDELLSP